MIKKFISAATLATVAITGFAASTASAQDYRRDSYSQYDGQDNRDEDRGGYRDQDSRYQELRQLQVDHRRYQEQRRRAQYRSQQEYRDYANDGYAQDGDGYRQSQYRRHRCTSGTTGAIVGGVLGALLGREVGRGGRYNDPSTTGAIIGAGGGALAGRAIERNACR